MGRIALALAYCCLLGCGALLEPNIHWAETHHIPYTVKELSPREWSAVVLTLYKQRPDVICLFVPPRTIYVKKGMFVSGLWWQVGGLLMMDDRTYKDACLEYEVGHLREFVEHLPFHSTYAW